MFVAQAVIGINGSRRYRYIKVTGSKVLRVKIYCSLKTVKATIYAKAQIFNYKFQGRPWFNRLILWITCSYRTGQQQQNHYLLHHKRYLSPSISGVSVIARV